MSILSAQSIRRLCINQRRPESEGSLISPFCERTVRNGMTYGLDSAGYDIRTNDSRVMWPGRATKVDAVEYFILPNNIRMKVYDKSTLIRRFIAVQNTKAEPGWRGYLRVELTSHSWWFRYIPEGSPIACVEFEWLDEPTEQPYRGKYQNQKRNQNAIYEGHRPRRLKKFLDLLRK